MSDLIKYIAVAPASIAVNGIYYDGLIKESGWSQNQDNFTSKTGKGVVVIGTNLDISGNFVLSVIIGSALYKALLPSFRNGVQIPNIADFKQWIIDEIRFTTTVNNQGVLQVKTSIINTVTIQKADNLLFQTEGNMEELGILNFNCNGTQSTILLTQI